MTLSASVPPVHTRPRNSLARRSRLHFMKFKNNKTTLIQVAFYLESHRDDILVTKKPYQINDRAFQKKGGDILSHITAVPSAQSGLTSLFGMGRGEPRRNNHLKRLNCFEQFF